MGRRRDGSRAGGARSRDRAARRGQYVLQAAIASLQTEEQIDWAQVAALYAQLAELTGSPVVELNRAVAIAQAGDPERALALVELLELDDYRYLHSTRGELLRRLGRREEARRRTSARWNWPAPSPSGASVSSGESTSSSC